MSVNAGNIKLVSQLYNFRICSEQTKNTYSYLGSMMPDKPLRDTVVLYFYMAELVAARDCEIISCRKDMLQHKSHSTFETKKTSTFEICKNNLTAKQEVLIVFV